MTPEQVAGHVMLTDLHNDLVMVGPFVNGDKSAVQVFLKNGYGISLATSRYGDEFPIVAPVWEDDTDKFGYRFAWIKHPDFAGMSTPDSERDCTPERAYEILAYFKSKE